MPRKPAQRAQVQIVSPFTGQTFKNNTGFAGHLRGRFTALARDLGVIHRNAELTWQVWTQMSSANQQRMIAAWKERESGVRPAVPEPTSVASEVTLNTMDAIIQDQNLLAQFVSRLNARREAVISNAIEQQNAIQQILSLVGYQAQQASA